MDQKLKDGLFICGLLEGVWFRFNLLSVPHVCPYCQGGIPQAVLDFRVPSLIFFCDNCGSKIQTASQF